MSDEGSADEASADEDEDVDIIATGPDTSRPSLRDWLVQHRPSIPNYTDELGQMSAEANGDDSSQRRRRFNKFLGFGIWGRQI